MLNGGKIKAKQIEINNCIIGLEKRVYNDYFDDCFDGCLDEFFYDFFDLFDLNGADFVIRVSLDWKYFFCC